MAELTSILLWAVGFLEDVLTKRAEARASIVE